MSGEERASCRQWNGEKGVSLGLGGGVGRETNKMTEGSGLEGMGQRWQGEVEGGDGLRFWKDGKQTWGGDEDK